MHNDLISILFHYCLLSHNYSNTTCDPAASYGEFCKLIGYKLRYSPHKFEIGTAFMNEVFSTGNTKLPSYRKDAGLKHGVGLIYRCSRVSQIIDNAGYIQ